VDRADVVTGFEQRSASPLKPGTLGGRSSMKKLAAVGFDLGDTLCEYAGVPLNWERQYAAALAAVADGCGLELSEVPKLENRPLDNALLLPLSSRSLWRARVARPDSDHC
jgi:hypothetical protein